MDHSGLTSVSTATFRSSVTTLDQRQEITTWDGIGLLVAMVNTFAGLLQPSTDDFENISTWIQSVTGLIGRET